MHILFWDSLSENAYLLYFPNKYFCLFRNMTCHINFCAACRISCVIKISRVSIKKTLSRPQSSYSTSSPMGVILLRVLGFLICAFLVSTFFGELPDQRTSTSGPQTLSGGVIPPKPKPSNESSPDKESSGGVPVWQSLLELIPDKAQENAKLLWKFGRDNQLAVVSVGLLTCLTAIFFAGPVR